MTPLRMRGPRSRRTHAVLFAAMALVLARPHRGGAQELEPPSEAAEGADYTIEAPDSLGDGDVEVGVGFTGSGSSATRRRHARFSGDSLDAAVSDGKGDALAGAQLEGPAGPGRFGLGRGSPAWGRGLLFGRPREPWSRSAPGTRRADGDLAWYRLDRGGLRLGAMSGRLDADSRHAFDLGAGAWSLGLSGAGRGVDRASAWWAAASRDGGRRAAMGELALDRKGRWLAEAAIDREVAAARLAGWARAGHALEGFARSKGPREALVIQLEPLEPRGARRDRARARGRARAAAGGDGPDGEPSTPRAPTASVSALAAWWRFAPGAEGARAVLEVEHALAQHARVLAGFEEQRGARRDPRIASTASRELRQGTWAEWRAARGPLELGWRHERWGARPWARQVVRVVSGARIGVRTARGVSVRLVHTDFRLRKGEHAYLAEREPDRLVLRALSGTGERLRLELAVPFGGGRIRAAADRTIRGSRADGVNWTIDWTRRAKARRAPAKSPAANEARELELGTNNSAAWDDDDRRGGQP